MRALALVIAAALFAGCSTRSQPRQPPLTAPFEHLYLRSTASFDHAIFLKPDPLLAGGQAQMLPLVMINSATPEMPLEFGTISGNEIHALGPVIYMALISPGDFLFFWFVRPRSADPHGEWRLRGIRMALDSQGIPILWRTLRDSSGATVVYAGEALESRALQNGLVPLPARQFAIEPEIFDEPDLVVPALVSDHPAPMGPWLYVEPLFGDIILVRCRCSPPRVQEIVSEGFYEVRNFNHEAQMAWDSPPGVLRDLEEELGRPSDWTARNLRMDPAP